MHPADNPEDIWMRFSCRRTNSLVARGLREFWFSIKNYTKYGANHPGGGTVSWTNPYKGEHKYLDNIEEREDGGTPGFLQVIKTALAIQLKEQMGIDNILKREHEIVEYVFDRLGNVPNINILAGQHQDRLGVISFYITDLHFNLGVKILNDKFGIQTRGGCSYGRMVPFYCMWIRKRLII